MKIRTGLTLSFAQNYVVFGLQFIASIVIARLLTPSEIGVFSVAVVLTTIANVLRDFGVGDYVAQEKDLTQDKLRAALAVSNGLAWTIALILFLASWSVAAFYEQAGVGEVMRILAFNFLLVPIGSVPMAYLRRNLEFGPIYVARVLAAASSTAAAILLASLGFSYLALAWAAVAAQVVMITIATIYRPRDVPLLPGLAEVRGVIRFGTLSSVTAVIWELDRGSPDMIFGRVLDMTAVALFGRAVGLVQLTNRLFVNAIWLAALPYFTDADRAGADMRRLYLNAVAMLTAIVWPALVLVAIYAFPLTRLLYGPQWDEAVPLVKWLALAEFVGTPFMFWGTLMIARGAMVGLTKLTALGFAVKVTALLMAAPLGLAVAVYGYLAAAVLMTAVYSAALHSVIGLTPVRLAGAVLPSLKVLAMTSAGPLLLAAVTHEVPMPALVELIIGVSCAAAGWFAAVWLFAHPLKAEIRRLTGQIMVRLSGSN